MRRVASTGATSHGNAPVERRERLGGLLNFYHRRAS